MSSKRIYVKRNANSQTFLSTVNKERDKEKNKLKKEISKEYEKINVLAKEQGKHLVEINKNKGTDESYTTWKKYQGCVDSIRQCRTTIVNKNKDISKLSHLHGGYMNHSRKKTKTLPLQSTKKKQLPFSY